MDNQPLAPASNFDYEAKRWGGASVYARPWYIQGLKLRYLLEDLAPIRGSCLDIGCGGGNMAKAIKRERPDLSVHGVDVSRSAIDYASRDHQGVEFRLAEAERLPYKDGQFDVVTMFDVLEHVADPVHVLSEVSRVLRPGGLFHIALPLEDQPGTIYRFIGAGRRWKAKLRCGGHIQLFDDSRFRAMAQMVGLPVKRVRWSYHPLFALIDVAYFTWLEWHGPVSSSVEDYLSEGRHRAGPLLRLAKNLIVSLGWYESRLLRWLPGACGHFTCMRRD
jgi:SAM-dependent methyltransferase